MSHDAFQMLVGIEVTDEAAYLAYRDGIAPLLEEYGGSFHVDVRVSEVLRAPKPASFNRMFTLEFPDRDTRDRFFSDERYAAVRAQFFEGSVGTVLRLSEGAVRRD